MKKVFLNTFAVLSIAALAVLCQSCDNEQKITPQPALAEKQPQAKDATPQSDIAARIDEYSITTSELEKRLLRELAPEPEEDFPGRQISAREMLLEMIAEKAMILDAREKNYTDDELVKKSVKQFKERKLVNLFLTTYLQGKVTSTGTEIEERIKAQPKLTREQAKSTIEGEKANRIIDSLYQEISQNRHVKKMKENFQQASDIHQRLMQKSVEVEKMPFIRETQVAELPANEKDIILAEFDGGKITMKDWFNTLCDFAPPSRPKNLNTPEGVEQLLERSMKMPLFVAEAASRGFDKDENFVKQAKGYEDMNLLGKAQREKYKDIKEPNSAELVAYFNAHKQDYAKGGAMKIDAIWCQDLKTAKTAKDEIAAGGDFKAVKQKYSLVKDIEPYETYRSSEGMFADDLFKGEPNQVVGPLKGFRGGAVKWRVVRILDKKPSEPMEYSAGVDGLLRDKIWMERRNAVMDAYNKQLLAKYKYTIYEDKIKAIDPLNVP